MSQAFLAFRKKVYGDHPFAHNPLGSPETVKAMDQAALLAAHAKLKGPGGAVLTVVGDVDPQAVISQVKRLFGPAAGQVAMPNMTPARSAQPAPGHRDHRPQGQAGADRAGLSRALGP